MAEITDFQAVLIHAPLRNDARMLADLLRAHDIEAVSCPTEEELEHHLETSLPGALVITQEGLTDRVVAAVGRHLHAQADWSELSVIVLVEKGGTRANLPRYLASQWAGSRQIFYQRPLATIELLSGVQSALLARLRQRDVRDFIGLEQELRRELNHRVKNILASVNSIFRMTSRHSGDLDELKRSFGGRLATLGSVHAALFATESEALDLAELVSLILSPYDTESGAGFTARGPGLTLGKDASTTLGLVIHELATNAIKYGAWSVPEGLLHVEWSIEGDRFRLRWSETGGPAPSDDGRTGYGTRYIRMALHNLLGEPPHIALGPAGLVLEAEGDLARVDTGGTKDRQTRDLRASGTVA